jgi:hypothetical protein
MPHFSCCYSLPLSKHTGGGDATPAFSGWLVYLQFACESVPPPTPVELSTWQQLLQAFPFLRLLGGVATPAFSSQLVYLQLEWGVPSPSLKVPHPLCYVSFFFQLLIYYSVFFSLFSLGGGQSVQGGYADLFQGCLWEYHVSLSSPVGLLFPSRIGAGIWQYGSSPGFPI